MTLINLRKRSSQALSGRAHNIIVAERNEWRYLLYTSRSPPAFIYMRMRLINLSERKKLRRRHRMNPHGDDNIFRPTQTEASH